MKKHTIEVDAEVFEVLQEMATPLVDTPNSVLRRLLLPNPEVISTGFREESPALPMSQLYARRADRSSRRDTDDVGGPPARLRAPDQDPYASLGSERRAEAGMSPRRFGQLLSAREFPGETFERARRDRGAFRTMFESHRRLLYFLTFNKPDATNLWYKVTSTALEALLGADKPAFLVFTNPAERVAWVIPVDELAAKFREVVGRRLGEDDVDLNVDVKGDRLRELDWGIGEYRREV